MYKIVRSRSKGGVPNFSWTKSFISSYYDNIRHNLQNQNCKISVLNTNVHRGRQRRRNDKKNVKLEHWFLRFLNI